MSHQMPFLNKKFKFTVKERNPTLGLGRGEKEGGGNKQTHTTKQNK